jgi:hypothetical protein
MAYQADQGNEHVLHFMVGGVNDWVMKDFDSIVAGA